MFKLVKIFPAFFFLASISVKAQGNKRASIKGYSDNSYNSYFDSLAKVTSSSIECLEKSFDAFVSFNVDTASKIVNFRIIEYPIAKLPDVAKRFIETLFKKTNGQWIPETVDSRKTVLAQFVWRISFIKKTQTMESRLADQAKISEYLITSKNDTVNKILSFRKWNYLWFSY